MGARLLAARLFFQALACLVFSGGISLFLKRLLLTRLTFIKPLACKGKRSDRTLAKACIDHSIPGRHPCIKPNLKDCLLDLNYKLEKKNRDQGLI